MVEAFGEGVAVKALARRHRADPKTIRRTLDAAGARALTIPPERGGERGEAPARHR